MKKDIKKYLIAVILILFAYIAYLIVAPFLTALLTSFILAYLSFPLYKKISKSTKSEVTGAILTTLLIIIIILLPLIYIANALVIESINFFNEGNLDNIKYQITQLTENDQIAADISKETIATLIEFMKRGATDFIRNLPGKVFDFLITIYATFTFFLIGEGFLKKAKNILPIEKKDQLIIHIGDTTYSIVYGLFLTAIIEFVLALIVFKLVGSSIALLLAITIGFLAFIPFLGPSIVWVPYIIYLVTRQEYIAAIVILILGIALFIIETFIRPKIIGARSKVHPLIILIGTIGGIKLLGIVGLVVGPVILSTIITIIKEYYPEIKKDD
ncbi:AI-2E family transporter [Candidatus Woesearchaeota archaeon]|nr:AI-2E family transporter [Candidatus Woesearchaeota archaeon]